MPATDDFTVSLKHAEDPLVLALDVGSTASRGSLHDRLGRPVKGLRHRVPHTFAVDPQGASTIDADAVVAELSQIITRLTDGDHATRIGAVALDTFASSVVGVGKGGRAVTPCYTYADSRCGDQVAQLRQELDEAAVQQQTGTRVHSSYLPARMRWLERTDPGLVARTPRWMSLGEYVHWRLLGTSAAATSTAAWSGLLDRTTGDWHAHLLDVSGLRREQLSDVQDPTAPLAPANDHVARHWAPLADVPWLAAVPDGYAANRGTGAEDASRMVASCATSGAVRVLVDDVAQVPGGLWAYRVDAGRHLLGGAVNDVGRAVTWVRDTVRLPTEPGALDTVLRAAPAPGTPLVLPFFTGERSTGWAAEARAHLAGVCASTTPELLFRGVVDGVALSYARIVAELCTVAGTPDELLVSGSITADLPGIVDVLANATGVDVVHVPIKRATLHGTALLALDVVDPGGERTPVPTAEPVPPVADQQDYWAERLGAFEELYAKVVG